MPIVQKLAKIMEAVERVPKRGRNEFHKYDYATESDIVAAIRSEFTKHSIMLIPAVTGGTISPVGDKGVFLTSLDMVFTFYDGSDGTSLAFQWKGYGTDKEDKGGYKAMTGGLKYFLLKTFLMPTGDDPEQDAQGMAQIQNELPKPGAKPEPEPEPAGFDKFMQGLGAAAPKGESALKEAWMNGTYDHRRYMQSAFRDQWEKLKGQAGAAKQSVSAH